MERGVVPLVSGILPVSLLLDLALAVSVEIENSTHNFDEGYSLNGVKTI